MSTISNVSSQGKPQGSQEVESLQGIDDKKLLFAADILSRFQDFQSPIIKNPSSSDDYHWGRELVLSEALGRESYEVTPNCYLNMPAKVRDVVMVQNDVEGKIPQLVISSLGEHLVNVENAQNPTISCDLRDFETNVLLICIDMIKNGWNEFQITTTNGFFSDYYNGNIDDLYLAIHSLHKEDRDFLLKEIRFKDVGGVLHVAALGNVEGQEKNAFYELRDSDRKPFKDRRLKLQETINESRSKNLYTGTKSDDEGSITSVGASYVGSVSSDDEGTSNSDLNIYQILNQSLNKS